MSKISNYRDINTAYEYNSVPFKEMNNEDFVTLGELLDEANSPVKERGDELKKIMEKMKEKGRLIRLT